MESGSTIQKGLLEWIVFKIIILLDSISIVALVVLSPMFHLKLLVTEDTPSTCYIKKKKYQGR